MDKQASVASQQGTVLAISPSMKHIALITSLLASLTGQARSTALTQASVSNQKTGAQIDNAQSIAEIRQRLISRVLQKNKVKPELFGSYKSSLLKIAAENNDVQKWLEGVDQYLDSNEFKNRNPSLQIEELADNRLLIELTVKALS